MGTWGTGLYSDDTASDVRSLVSDLRKLGISGIEAVRIAEAQFDTNETSFWLALADCLWKDGRLPLAVKMKALDVILAQEDQKNWSTNSSSLKKRNAVLKSLDARLRSDSPPPKRLRERFVDVSPWSAGQLVTYVHSEGHIVVMRVAGHFTCLGGKSPVFEVLDWCGTTPPDLQVAETLTLLLDEQNKMFGDRVPGAKDPEGQLKLWQDKNWLPQDATWMDWQLAWKYRYFVPIRHKSEPAEWRRLHALGIETPSPRRFFPRVVPPNSWRLWKDFELSLAGSFSRYRVKQT